MKSYSKQAAHFSTNGALLKFEKWWNELSRNKFTVPVQIVLSNVWIKFLCMFWHDLNWVTTDEFDGNDNKTNCWDGSESNTTLGNTGQLYCVLFCFVFLI